jgi:hypothetical protein
VSPKSVLVIAGVWVGLAFRRTQRGGLGSDRAVQWEILLARRYRRTGAAPLHEEVVRPPRTRRGKREYPLLGNRLVRTATCGVAHRLSRSFCEEFSADTSPVGTAAKKNLGAVPTFRKPVEEIFQV